MEELLCAAVAVAAEGAEVLGAEEAGGRSVSAAFPKAAAALSEVPRTHSAALLFALMSLGAGQRTEDSPFCFLRDRDEKRAAEGIWQ